MNSTANHPGDREAIPHAVADALTAAVSAAAPSDLFDRLHATAESHRPGGRVIALGTNAAEPVDAFVQTANELLALLDELTPAEWASPTATAYGTVRDVVAHLAGSEDYCTRALNRVAAADPKFDFDHPACSREVASSLAALTTAELSATWFALANTFAEACRNDTTGLDVSLHLLPVSVSGALVLRTFELWAHMEDICAAVGRPLPRLDGPRLATMSSRLVGAIGGTIASAAKPNATGRLVLLGPGGGVAELGAPNTGTGHDVRIVADVVDYCRIASRRIAIADLACTIEGDERLVMPFLTATAMFAKD